MPRKRWMEAMDRPQQSAARPLLAPAIRPTAAVLAAVCAAVTGVLGAQYTHPGRAGWSCDEGLLNFVTGIGDPVPVTVMTVALVVACLATHRWHGALLVAVAVPLASALTEFLLKPLVDRTMQGALSFPSGHTTGMFALAGVCTVLLAGPSRPRTRVGWRVLLGLAAYLAATAVAVAMVGLGAHYFTDTAAGAAVGTSVVLLTALILDRLGRPGPAAPARPAGARACRAEVSAC